MKIPCRVFLSYAKEDIASARNLYEGLRNITFVEVWFDEKSLIPGQNWKKEISKAIKTSDIFIALISRNSINKRGIVQKELKEAINIMEELPQGKIYLIPVRLDNVTPSHDFLSDIHWVNLFEDWDQGVHQIMKAICFDYFKDRIPTEDFTVVDLEQILKNISELLPTKLSSKKYQLIFSNYSTNPIVLGNKDMLTLVFCNVITNAIDFSMPKDMISRIEVFIKLYENGPWMFVQVQNHGQPIDEKDIIYGRIFKPFFTTSSKGIGLGLAVTKMVVEKHGGTIFVISTPTMSSSFEKAQSNLFCTTFAITLPRIINCKK